MERDDPILQFPRKFDNRTALPLWLANSKLGAVILTRKFIRFVLPVCCQSLRTQFHYWEEQA